MTQDFRTPLEKLDNVQLSEIEQRIRACTSTSELHQLLKQQQEIHGTMTRKRDGSIEYGYGSQPVTTEQAAPQSKPADDGQFRSVWMRPDGSLQVLEASSITGLDTIERSFYNWKGARKLK